MRRISHGLSLVEILVTIMVVAIGLLPVFGLFSQSAKTYRFGRDEVVATMLAHELADQIRGMPFSDIPVISERPLADEDNGAELFGDQPATVLSMSPLGKDMERYLSITEIHSRLKKVSCRVTWGHHPIRSYQAEVLCEWHP